MAAAAPAPSTAAPNPLEASMKRALGERTELPANAVGYDPNASFRPEGDVLNIVPGLPGTGMTGYETKQVGFKEEEMRRSALEQEFENRMKEEEAARQASASEIQRAQEAREAALGPSKLSSAELANQAARQGMEQTALGMKYATTGEARQAAEAAQKAQMNAQAMAQARAEEERKGIESFYKYGGQSLAERQAAAQTGAARFGWELAAQQPLGPIGTARPPVVPVEGSGSRTAYTQATGYAGAQLGPYGQPQLIVPYGGNAGARGYVSPQGMYSTGSGMDRYLGAPGSAVFNSSMQAMNPANIGRPSYMWV